MTTVSNSGLTTTRSGGKIALLCIAALMLFVWIYCLSHLDNLQHPAVFVVVAVVASLAYAYGVYEVYSTSEYEPDTKKYQVPLVIATALFLAVTIGVVTSAKNNREQGIPKSEVITANGYIPDPEAYIDFHEKHQSDPSIAIRMDAETKSYIRQQHQQPDWIVIGGYTKDATGWVSAHPQADEKTKSYVLSHNGQLPDNP